MKNTRQALSRPVARVVIFQRRSLWTEAVRFSSCGNLAKKLLPFLRETSNCVIVPKNASSFWIAGHRGGSFDRRQDLGGGQRPERRCHRQSKTAPFHQLANAYCSSVAFRRKMFLRLSWHGRRFGVLHANEIPKPSCVVPCSTASGQPSDHQINTCAVHGLPYEVVFPNGENSATSALFYGFKATGRHGLRAHKLLIAGRFHQQLRLQRTFV